MDDNKPRGWAPKCCMKVVVSAGYYMMIMAAIVTNAIAASWITFKHDKKGREELFKNYYYREVRGSRGCHKEGGSEWVQ